MWKTGRLVRDRMTTGVRVEHDGGAIDVHAAQAVLTRAGERVR